MENNDVVNEPADVAEEPTVEADVKEVISALLVVMRDQDKRITAE